MGNATVVVATSIPPRLIRQDANSDFPGYQRFCVRSWISNGFRVLSINHPEEIASLAPLYPEVEFIAATRDAREWTGRNNPYIADLLAGLVRTGAPVLGIINSDLLFEPSSAWEEELPALVPRSMVVAHRYNANALRGGSLRQYLGLDCFFFDKAMASSLLDDAMPYAMGLPWWDCWLPCVALLQQRDIIVVDRPAVMHLAHQQAYSAQAWSEFARIFALSMIRGVEKSGPTSPISGLLPLFREIELHASERRNFNHLSVEFSHAFISTIRANPVSWKPADDAVRSRPGGAELAGPFARFDERARAGHALSKARELRAANKWSEIGPELIAALTKVPDDADIVLTLGEISFHQSDLSTASARFMEAAKLSPNSEYPLLMLGKVLARTGQSGEALDCFRQILTRQPSYEPAYAAAAKLLWQTGARRDAVEFLEQAIADRPELTSAAELCRSYRDQLGTGVREKTVRLLKSIKSTFAARLPGTKP